MLGATASDQCQETTAQSTQEVNSRPDWTLALLHNLLYAFKLK